MIENKKIDILMATYNGEKYLAEQLDSIINQTYHNWNLLIRDDNSTDRTLEIIQDYQKKDNRIKLLKDNKGNLGIVKNFEELLKNSESEFIMFSDQDDIWVENKLDMYLKMIEKIKNKGFMIHSDAILFDKNKSNILKDTFISKKAINKGLENVFFNYFVQGATILISKEIKNFILPFPKEVYLHDRYIHLISELFFERIFVNKALIYYRQHGDNQIGAKNTIRELLSKRYFDERDRQLIKVIYNKYGSLLTEDKKKLIEVATYPLILLGFLLLIMLGLRNYLLPQLDSSNIATQIIGNLPQIFLGMVGFVSVGVLLALTFYKRSSKMRVFSILARLPFLGIFVQTYLTAYYAREWGNMISQGMELMQIFQIMQEQGSQLFKEIGRDLAQALQNGREFSQTIATYPFFKKELSLIIEYGEVKSKLGSELEIYAEKTWETFFTRVNRTMNLVQPLVFIFVALIIVLLYAAMLMPMYQNMEVNF